MHTAFNYAVNLLILPSAVGDCVSISAFALLLGIHLGLTSSAVWLKICAMTARIKKYKSIIKKKNNQHFKIVLLAKLNAINILISNALIDSYINYKEFVFTNLFKEYKTKKKSKILKLLWNILCKFGWYKQKNLWKSGVETIMDNDGISWLNEKHKICETIKYHSENGKHRYGLVDEPKKTIQLNFHRRKISNQSNSRL